MKKVLKETRKCNTLNKNEKRRLQLSKRHENNAPVGGVAVKEFRLSDMNRRLLAAFLALAMVLTVLPFGFLFLKPKAEETSAAMEAVDMYVRINGTEQAETVSVDAGLISDHVSGLNVSLPAGAEYVKAVIVDGDTEAETQIYAVGKKGDAEYYSIDAHGYTGVAKDKQDKLVLVYANKYYVDFGDATFADGKWTRSDLGSFTANVTPEMNADTGKQKYFVYGDTNLQIKEITPAQDRSTGKVSYTTGGNAGSERVSNSTATIPSNMYAGDIHVTVNFNEVENYSVQDARYMSGSKYYASYYGLDNHGGTTANESNKGSTNSLGTVKPDQNKTIYVYSQKNTTGSEVWRLSMLSVNGEDLAFPNAVNTSVTTATNRLGNVTVTFVNESKQFSDDKSNSPRTLYKIEIPKVHENIEVNYYFTNIRERKIIVKGLEGINKTAAAVEHRVLTGNLVGKWYTYTSNSQNVYEAFYDSRANYPSDNLILYTVKPGYNPYQIDTKLFVNGTDVTSSIRATNVTGTPEQVIKQAGNQSGSGNFNTAWRYWGKNSTLINDAEKRWGDTLLLTTLSKDKTNQWFAVALAQGEAATSSNGYSTNNQQLYLNAKPYEYYLRVDLNGGALTDSGYSVADSIASENVPAASPHTIASNSYAYLPAAVPTRNGYVFDGYKMLYKDGENVKEVDDTLYQPSDRIDINKTTIAYSLGDVKETAQPIGFKAQWTELKNAKVTQVFVDASYQSGFDSDGQATYNSLPRHEETQVIGNSAVLDDHALLNGTALSTSPYYVLSSDSELMKTTKAVNSDGTYDKDNYFSVKYDYNLPTLTVTNKVLGNVRAKSFETTVTLTKDENSPVTVEQVKTLNSNSDATVSADETTVTIKKLFSKGESLEVIVPYGWNYSVTEEEGSGYDISYAPEQPSGTMQTDSSVLITNTVNNSGIHSSKTLSGPDENGNYSITMEAYATGENIIDEAGEAVPMDVALVIDQSGSMGTEDMNVELTYKATSSRGWTVTQATGSTQYYYKVGSKYYPVQAQEGEIYDPVTTNVYSLQMTGTGHDGISVAVNGAPTHFNVPTNYYALGTDGKIHKVYMITAGMFLEYYAYPYYYLNENDAYAAYSEWTTNIYWVAVFSPWDGNDYSKLQNDSKWKTLTNNSRVRFVGQSSLNQTAAKAARVEYSWISNGDAVKNLYLPRDGMGYNALYYVDDNGVKQPIGSTVYTDEQYAYTGVLYTQESKGETRVSALQTAVNQFTEALAENAKENNVDHRIGIIGFAGNKFPGSSSGSTAYNTTKYDYTNSGLFLNNTFKNYQKITGYKSVSTKYINRHYYIYASSSYIPVYYSNGYWYRLDNGNSVNSSTTFYEPVYEDLSAADYQAALVEASQKTGDEYNGTVNANIQDAVNHFANYGGTYTSYGIHMANQLFANNTQTWTDKNGEEQQRKRVIVVFTDGEPGKNGYSSSIAGEALVDGNAAKYEISEGGLDATVYTIGLFPGNASADVKSFMEQLSSEYTVPLNNVYSVSNSFGGAIPTNDNNHGAGNLDPNKTYYFTGSDGKTTAVTTRKDGLSTLGWWYYSGTAWTHYYPMAKSGDERTINGESVTQFYDQSGNKVYEDDLNTNTYYYVNSSRTMKVYYEYRWFDSNNLIREPKYVGDTSTSSWQFFELGTPVENTDDIQYYYDVKNQDALVKAFAKALETMADSSTRVNLGPDNAFLQDTITQYFDTSHAEVTCKAASGTWVSDTEITWGDAENIDSTRDGNVEASRSGNVVTVTRFKYNDCFVGEDHPGRKLIVTIDGLVPKTENLKATGFNIPSNTDDSGVYEYPKLADGTLDKDNPKQIQPFVIPTVNRPEYLLKLDGDDTTAQYTVQMKLLDQDEQPVTADQWVKIASSNSALAKLTVDNNNGVVTIWNDVTTALGEDSAILENVFKSLPEGYTVQACVTKANDTPATYDYAVTRNGQSAEDVDFDSWFAITPNNTSIEVTSTRKIGQVKLREYTYGRYADPSKEFRIYLTLKDVDTPIANKTYDGLTFDEKGVATVVMRHEQVRSFNLPVGYTLSVDVDADDQKDTGNNYWDSYASNLTETVPTVTTPDFPATAITNGMEITVINAKDGQGTPTGILEETSAATWILIGFAVLSAGAGAGYVVYRKRKET